MVSSAVKTLTPVEASITVVIHKRVIFERQSDTYLCDTLRLWPDDESPQKSGDGNQKSSSGSSAKTDAELRKGLADTRSQFIRKTPVLPSSFRTVGTKKEVPPYVVNKVLKAMGLK